MSKNVKNKNDLIPPIPAEDANAFIAGTPYVKSKTNFCLGTTLEEVGAVLAQLAELREKEERDGTPE